jgi:hypothetical protein
MRPAILETQPAFKKILGYHGIPFTGDKQFKVPGFDQHNWLVDINACFSNAPSGDIIDRTQTVPHPWRLHVQRPWQIPGSISDLETCFVQRTKDLLGHGQQLNLLWSGGIDSTAMLTSFLRHGQSLDQLRVLYTINSIKENPGFFLLLQQRPELELIEFGGDTYLEQQLDGLFVSADGADDITASLDQSFYEQVGWSGLQQSWKDFLFEKTNSVDFVNFCEHWFDHSGCNIQTVLQARWWFYTACKIQKFPTSLAGLIRDDQPLPQGFYDCELFEHWSAHNLHLIMPRASYASYKQCLKDYIYDYDHDQHYRDHKQKENSAQLSWYRDKRQALQGSQYIMLLADGQRIRTPNLPLLSEREYRACHGHSLDYLFEHV